MFTHFKSLRNVNINFYKDHLTNSCAQGFGSGSGSGLDPYSIGPVDPDPDPYSESGSGSRRAKMTHKSRKKKIDVLKCWMASFVSCRLLL
jgi:hypothetical protein